GKVQIVAAVGDEDAKLAPLGRVRSARLLRSCTIWFWRSRTGCVMRDVCHSAAPIAALNISTSATCVGPPIAGMGQGNLWFRPYLVGLWHKADLVKRLPVCPLLGRSRHAWAFGFAGLGRERHGRSRLSQRKRILRSFAKVFFVPSLKRGIVPPIAWASPSR